jgi:uncharacterized protein (DUF302 family)
MNHAMSMILLFCTILAPAHADEIFLTAEKQSEYRAALDDLSIAITDLEYTIIKIQPVDKGLRKKGYETDNYKLVFFGDKKQMDRVLKANPEASVLLPLKIIIYQDAEMVIASAPSLAMWKGVFGEELDHMIDSWQTDIQAILKEFARTPDHITTGT